MSKQTTFSRFLSKLEEYENTHDDMYIQLISNGRQILQSVYNKVNNEQLTNLSESFINFMSLLTQCHSNSLLDKKNDVTLHTKKSKHQNESQDLLPKNDLIKIVNNDLQCPICNDWLFRATSTNCDHTFCEICIKKWLKINNTCPVCRTTIQYFSTSIAVDNFISNMCQLFGGSIKEKRKSIQNYQRNHKNDQTNIDSTVEGLFNNLSISQSFEDDTSIYQLETTIPMTHPNMVRLIPRSPGLQNPVPETNLRQLRTSSNTPHPNMVQLSSLANINECPNIVRLIPLSQPSPIPITSDNIRQLIASNTPHPNTVQLSPYPESSTASMNRLHNNRIHSPTPISPSVNQFRNNTNNIK